MPGTPPTSPIPQIVKTTSPNFPQFVFEWHPWTQKVYEIELPGEWVEGVFHQTRGNGSIRAECLAEHCEDQGKFIGFVQTFLRGYKKGVIDGGK